MIRNSLMMLCLMQLVLSATPLLAQDSDTGKHPGRGQLIKSMGRGATLMHAAPAAINGFEELIVRDDRGLDHVFYLSKDGRMAFSGSLLDIQSKKNITQVSYRTFVAAEIAKGLARDKKLFMAYHQDAGHGKKRPPLYVFLGPDCPDCLHHWINTLPALNKDYDIRVAFGGMGSLETKQVRKAMQGWCLKEDARSVVLGNHPPDAKASDCKSGIKAFNQLKLTFGRYIRRVPVAFNQHGEEVPLRVSVKGKR